MFMRIFPQNAQYDRCPADIQLFRSISAQVLHSPYRTHMSSHSRYCTKQASKTKARHNHAGNSDALWCQLLFARGR